jgi:predicted alpha/beta superfamily hydrolase
MDLRIVFWVVVVIASLALFYVITRDETPRERPRRLKCELRMHRAFHSRFLARDRDIIVYLPPCYFDDPHRRYAVFYLHDGQNLFDPATSFIPGQDWKADETADELIASGRLDPLIIVGIYNMGEDRIDEYTPTRDARHNRGGKADLYGRFIVEELKPFIDSAYRTLKDPGNTGLGGSSLGGLVSLYLALKYPDVFGKVAAMSPSVWWDDRAIIKKVESLKDKPRLRVWLDMGTNEGSGPHHLRGAATLRDTFVGKGWREGKDLLFFVASGGAHSETAWGGRFDLVLRFLFPKTTEPQAGASQEAFFSPASVSASE